MKKPEDCKFIECQECGNLKYCPERGKYIEEIDAAFMTNDFKKVSEIVQKWLGIWKDAGISTGLKSSPGGDIRR